MYCNVCVSVKHSVSQCGLEKNYKFLCRHRKGHSPLLTPIHFTFWCHECTHFAWISFSAYRPNVIQPAYTVMYLCCCQCTHFAQTSLMFTTYPHSWCTHCAWICCTDLYPYLFQPLFSLALFSVYNQTVQLYTSQGQTGSNLRLSHLHPLRPIHTDQSQQGFDLPASL